MSHIKDRLSDYHDFMKKLNPNVKVIWGYARTA